MDRRRFLKASLAAGGALAALAARSGRAPAQPAPARAVLKLASQEGRLPGKTLPEKVENLKKFGGVGIEFGGDPRGRIEEIRKVLGDAGVAVAALCWGSHNGDLVSTDAARRQKGIDDLKRALETAGQLGSTGVVFVPCFNKQSDLGPAELDKVLLDILPAIGEHAVAVKSRVLLEPLNKGETFYVNRIEQAAAICRQVGSPGICLMGDFYHMCKEEKDDEAAFVTGGPWLHHVHLASRTRVLPGQDQRKEPNKDERSFVAGFRGLKKVGYQDYCSLECGCVGDPMVEIAKSFEFLRRQWDEAAV